MLLCNRQDLLGSNGFLTRGRYAIVVAAAVVLALSGCSSGTDESATNNVSPTSDDTQGVVEEIGDSTNEDSMDSSATSGEDENPTDSSESTDSEESGIVKLRTRIENEATKIWFSDEDGTRAIVFFMNEDETWGGVAWAMNTRPGDLTKDEEGYIITNGLSETLRLNLKQIDDTGTLNGQIIDERFDEVVFEGSLLRVDEEKVEEAKQIFLEHYIQPIIDLETRSDVSVKT